MVCDARVDVARRREFEAIAEQIRNLEAFGPLGAPGNLRRLGPFAIVVACTVASLVLDPDVDVVAAAIASGLGLVVLLLD